MHPLSTSAKAAGIRAAGRPPSGRANGLRPPGRSPGPPRLGGLRRRACGPPHHPASPPRPSQVSAPPQILPNYPGNKSPASPIFYANQTPVCKTSVNKCCFLTLPMQKPPVFAVLVEGLFPPRPKNLPLPLSSPRRLWYNIPWTFANISKR